MNSENGSSQEDIFTYIKGTETRQPWLEEGWYKNHRPHRDDGPAIIYADGRKTYYQDGLVHREDGPAVIVPREVAERTKFPLEGWYQQGKQHRIGAPAMTFSDGRKIYFEYGKKIKTVYPDGHEELA